MKFIKNKSLIEGEEFIFIPRLHWFYIFKPVFQALPFFIVMLFLRIFSNNLNRFIFAEFVSNYILRNVFLAFLVVLLVIIVARLFKYINTEYAVTSKRLMIKTGIFRVVVAEIPTDRIESIYCVQGLWDRAFKCGSVFFSGIGGRMPAFYMICSPYGTRRRIAQIIEKNKTITVVHGTIPKPPPKQEQPKVKKEDPPHLFGSFVKVIQ